ncbi:shematrin-like protein 2 [Varroa jacobsoni]|uniref:shematrin-like protein 2 n=1 Tax=Varroa jacobsoni TaxID=62625 RepID=UPI000BF93236|nr:shematrin-like protein 2 [Varroa jacobsoni]
MCVTPVTLIRLQLFLPKTQKLSISHSRGIDYENYIIAEESPRDHQNKQAKSQRTRNMATNLLFTFVFLCTVAVMTVVGTDEALAQVSYKLPIRSKRSVLYGGYGLGYGGFGSLGYAGYYPGYIYRNGYPGYAKYGLGYGNLGYGYGDYGGYFW